MVRLTRSASTESALEGRHGTWAIVLPLAAIAFVFFGAGLSFIRHHLVQIRAEEPALAVIFVGDPLLNFCILVALQTSIVTALAGVLVFRIHRAAFLLFAATLVILSFFSIAWVHLLGPGGEKNIPADSLTTTAESLRGVPLTPAEGTSGFALRLPKPELFAPATEVWTAAKGPAKFVSEPLPADTLPVLRIIFRGDIPLPRDFVYLESATHEKSTLAVGRFAQDRWQFGHVALPSGGRVRLVVELPAGSGGFAFQNPIPIGRAVWFCHNLLKVAPWFVGVGLVLFAGFCANEWSYRQEVIRWTRCRIAAIQQGTDVVMASPIRRWVASRTFAVIALVGVFTMLAWRQHHYVDEYAVNIMSLDQWDFYRPLFEGSGWWATFTQQHGPHRQGIGFVITRVFAEMGGWNSRWDAFLISYFLAAAGGLAWMLTRRFRQGPTLAWLGVPLLFFNVRQDPAIIGAANLSHGSMPVFLIMATGLAWFIERIWLRYALVCTLTFCLVFTGFGLFMGLVTPVLFAIEGVHAARTKDWLRLGAVVAGLVAVGLTWLTFKHGYKFDPAIGEFRFPYEKPWEYVEFAGLLVSFFLGVPGTSALAMVVGVAGLTALGLICSISAWVTLRDGPHRATRHAVIFCFAAFTLIFCASTAIGRVMGGMDGALAHRYVTLLIPGGFAVLLYLLSQPGSRFTRSAVFCYVVLLAVGTTWLHQIEWDFSQMERDGRLAWKRAYLATHSETEANETAGFQIYPGSVKERLGFLERRRVNLFNPAGQP